MCLSIQDPGPRAWNEIAPIFFFLAGQDIIGWMASIHAVSFNNAWSFLIPVYYQLCHSFPIVTLYLAVFWTLWYEDGTQMAHSPLWFRRLFNIPPLQILEHIARTNTPVQNWEDVLDQDTTVWITMLITEWSYDHQKRSQCVHSKSSKNPNQ